MTEMYRLQMIVSLVGVRPIAPFGADPSQDWFWTPQWRQMEREADEDVAAGRVARFDDADAMFAYLNRER